jgi:uncharacterized membrane protein
MLVGGAAAEIVSTFSDDTAGLIMLGLGLIGAVITAALHQKGSDRTGFLTGSILLMTTAMHIGGLYLWAGDADLPGAIVPMLHLYVATITLAVGIFIDVRLITALAIVPFAQMLDTGTFYWHAMYAFYSPETTLSILQLSVAMAVCVAVSDILVDRYRPHTHIFGIMAFIVANMWARVMIRGRFGRLLPLPANNWESKTQNHPTTLLGTPPLTKPRTDVWRVHSALTSWW